MILVGCAFKHNKMLLEGVNRWGISIIADDLTGASDTGIQFRKYGLKTKVIVDVNQLEQFLDSDEVLAINSNTRPLHGEKAYKIVYDICCLLKQSGFTRIYKKWIQHLEETQELN